MEAGGKKLTVLLCADDLEYVKKMYEGYFRVFLRMLVEEGETWAVFYVARSEFPEDDNIGKFDGFVITSSCNDAHGNDAWIYNLLNILKGAIEHRYTLDALKSWRDYNNVAINLANPENE